MLKTKQSLFEFKKKLRLFGKFLCTLIKFKQDHKKKILQPLKYLEICIFLYCFFFGGSPLNFDKGRWYYTYIEQFLKNDRFLMFSHNFVTPISNLVITLNR